MPDNPIPATQPEAGAAPGELNFEKPVSENPRIKRRSLKAKTAPGLIKAAGAPPAARELEREAPPLPAEETATTKPGVAQPARNVTEAVPPKVGPAPKNAAAIPAPPRTTPTAASSAPSARPAAAASTSAAPLHTSVTSSAAQPAVRSTVTPSGSPHGTRPATLYYTSPTKKAETPTTMKTTPTATPAASSSASSATTIPTSVARPTAASTSRPASTVDYRANVERQSREQKSVGNILSYIVYAFIALFVITVGLAGYGADIIFAKIHDQSVTVSDLDARYAAANKDLNEKLAATQQTLTDAQAQIARQQDLILKQQDAINKLIAATNANSADLQRERQARAESEANLRTRIREVDARIPEQPRY